MSESLEVQTRGGVLLLRTHDEGEVPNYFNLSPHQLALVFGGNPTNQRSIDPDYTALNSQVRIEPNSFMPTADFLLGLMKSHLPRRRALRF